MRQPRGAAVVCLGLVVLAGCGSTVPAGVAQPSSSRGAAGAAGPGALDNPLGSPEAGLAGPAPAGPAEPAGAAPGGVRAGSARGGADAGARPRSGGAARPGAVRKGRFRAPTSTARGGVTDTEIRLGITYLNDRDAGNQAFAGSGVPTTGSAEDKYDAVVAWINARGGIAGRRLVAVHRPFNTAEMTSDARRTTQSICSRFTEDDRVLAVVPEDATDLLVSCLAKRSVVSLVQDAVPFHDEVGFARHADHLFYASSFNLTRAAREVAATMLERRLAGRGTSSVIGLVVSDTPEFRRATSSYIAEMRAGGQAVDQENIVYTSPEDLGRLSAQVSSAVLRFRQNGVNRVSFIEAQGVNYVTFLNSAESQGYRPRYGLSSAQYAQGLLAIVPVEQVRGSVGFGWNPAYDVMKDPVPPPRAAQCLEIMRAGRVMPASRVELAAARKVCDALLFAKHVLDRTTDLSPRGIRSTIEASGRAYLPAQTLGAFHGPRHHDGAGAGFAFRFDDDCGCFLANGPLRWAR